MIKTLISLSQQMKQNPANHLSGPEEESVEYFANLQPLENTKNKMLVSK